MLAAFGGSLPLGWLLLGLASRLASGDLDVHCEPHQVLGKWTLKLSKTGNTKTDVTTSFPCSEGGTEYQSKEDNYGLSEKYNWPVADEVHIELTSDTDENDKLVAVLLDEDKKPTQEKGTWTMIYDEGWEVRIPTKPGGEKQVLFAYSLYRPVDEGTESHCGSTYPGWVHDWENPDNESWGCYVATKDDPVQAQLFSKNFGKADDLGAISMLELYTDEQEQALVDHINSHPEATWTAKRYAAHEKPHRKALGNPIKAHKRLRRPVELAQVEVDVSDLPEAHDWSNVNGESFVQTAINQGGCGSCYSVATNDQITSRIALLQRFQQKKKKDMSLLQTGMKTDKAWTASPQSILTQAGMYAQGCDGGFPYLSAKYAKDLGVTSLKSVPYTAKDDKQQQCPVESELIARVNDYNYVGGYYGAATESSMKRDIFDNGPVTVGIEVDPMMNLYQGGVFDTNLQLPDQDHYERVNHAVNIVGWGKDHKGTPYWKVKNSWGAHWGEDGYIRVKAGDNLMNIEHMLISVKPIIATQLPASDKAAGMSFKQKSFGHAVLNEHRQQAGAANSQVTAVEDDAGSSWGAGDKILDPAFLGKDGTVPEA